VSCALSGLIGKRAIGRAHTIDIQYCSVDITDPKITAQFVSVTGFGVKITITIAMATIINDSTGNGISF